MQKRKLQILVGILAAFAVAALFYSTRENDPIYQGKRFSAYLEELPSGFVSIRYATSDQPPQAKPDVAVNVPAYAAVEHVGTNALPLLVRALQNKESRLGLWVRTKAPKLPLIGKLFRTDRPHPELMRSRSLAALRRLGPRAALAIPDIIPLLEDPECAIFAVAAMGYIRPTREKDIVSLTNVFSIHASTLFAILTLSTFGTNASSATPALVGCLASLDGRVRGAAAAALVRIGASPEQVVPLIIENLPKTNPLPLAPLRGPTTQASISARMARGEEMNNAMMTLWALGEYGTRARAALPAISNLFNYPVVNVQTRAMEAAAKILADTNSVPR